MTEEDRYQILFAGNPIPMWVHDRETLRFLDVNEAAIRHYGYTREETLRQLIREILEGAGHTVIDGESPEAALEAVRSHTGPIQLLLTDVVMPRWNGPEVVRRVAALRPEIKVLYMSGYTDEAIGQHGVLEAGVQFIQKPFTTEALLRKVHEVLDGG